MQKILNSNYDVYFSFICWDTTRTTSGPHWALCGTTTGWRSYCWWVQNVSQVKFVNCTCCLAISSPSRGWQQWYNSDMNIVHNLTLIYFSYKVETSHSLPKLQVRACWRSHQWNGSKESGWTWEAKWGNISSYMTVMIETPRYHWQNRVLSLLSNTL